jgi:ATP-dependent protease ClpP protease subunit
MGFIARHWRGENSLAFAYWVNAVLLQLLLSLAIVWMADHTEIFDTPPRAIGGLTFIAAVTTWALVGVWRSAGNSMAAAQWATPPRRAIWAYIARFMVVVGFLQALGTLLPLYNDAFEAEKLRSSPLATEFNLYTRAETDVVLEGYINGPSVAAVKKAFAESKERNALVISSPGGFLADAFDLADFVKEAGVFVAVNGTCHSACTLVLAAAETRLATPTSSIALHHPAAAGDFASSEVRDLLSGEIREYYARLSREGFDEGYIARLKKEGWIWLSLAEASRLGLVDYLWDPVQNEIAPLADVCAVEDCSINPVKLSKALSSYR